MSAPQSNAFVWIEITLAELVDPTNTITLKVGSKVDSAGDIYPILESYKVGNKQDQFLPARKRGRVTLDNKYGCIGASRRLSDLFDRYTPIGQVVSFYEDRNEPDDDSAVSATPVWVDTCTGYSLGDDGSRLVLELESDPIRDRVLTYQIDSTALGAEQGVNNSSLPLVVGEGQGTQVVAVKIQEDDDSARYAYATIGAFNVGGVQTVYLKNPDGNYQAMVNAASISTPVVDETPTSGTETRDIWEAEEYALQITGTGHLVTRIRHFFASTGSVTEEFVEGHIYKSIGAGDALTVGDRIATGKTELSGNLTFYGAIDGTYGLYSTDVILDTPVLLTSGESFFVSIRVNSDYTAIQRYYYTGSTAVHYIRPSLNGLGDTENRWKPTPVAIGQIHFQLYASRYSDSSTGGVYSRDEFGYKPAYIQFDANAGVLTGEFESDLSRLAPIVEVNGLIDDGSGTITGTPNQTLENPVHLIEALLYTYNGTSWVAPAAGTFDATYKSDTHVVFSDTSHSLYRKIAFVTSGRATLRNVLSRICEESLSRIVRISGSTETVGLWAYGTDNSETSPTLYTDDTITNVRYSATTRSRIVNKAKVDFKRQQVSQAFLRGNELFNQAGYQANAYMAHDDGGIGQSISAKSFTLFGEQEIGKSSFDYIYDATSMANVLEGIFRQHSAAYHECHFTVPIAVSTEHQPMTVVHVASTALPYFPGANNELHLGLNTSEEQYSAGRGDKTVRALKTWRCQIIDVEREYTKGQALLLTFRCKVLRNEQDPT